MMSLTFGLFTQVSGSGPLGPLVFLTIFSSPERKALRRAYSIGMQALVIRPSMVWLLWQL